MKSVAEMALVLGCAALGAVATWKIGGPPSRAVACDPAAISPLEICLESVRAEWSEGSFVWIDARSEEEWRRDGLPGSVHLTTAGGANFDEQLLAAGERLIAVRRAVVYCGSSGCGTSKEVAKRIVDYGLLPEARALHGGWDALRQAGWIKDSSPAN
jgi:rhodanese-related sulfurtransferase